jgi:hypothetical protein
MIHDLIIALIILGSTIGGLLLLAVAMATGRAVFDKKSSEEIWAITSVAEYEAKAAKESYPHKALVALDIGLNVVVLGGRQGETISTHSGIAATEGKAWGRLLHWWLGLIEVNHCLKAAASDLWRASAEEVRMKSLLGLK